MRPTDAELMHVWHRLGAHDVADVLMYDTAYHAAPNTGAHIEAVHRRLDAWDVLGHVREGVRSYLPERQRK